MIKKAAVIGAGIAGIAMANRLAAKGYQVDVFEKNLYPGGKLSETRLNNYRFDAGPSLFTLPELVDEQFTLLGENPADHFRYTKLDKLCHYFYADGISFYTSADPEITAENISQATGENKAHILGFLKQSRALYELTADIFITRPFEGYGQLLSPAFFKMLSKMRLVNANTTMAASLEKTFTSPKVVQLFNRYATYNGSDPYRAPATLNLIPHLEYNLGAYLPENGMIDITRSLVALGERHGVTYHYGALVNRILYADGKVTGILLGHKTLEYDYVVTDVDIHFVYRELLPGIRPPAKILQQERSSSALVFNWGIKKTFDQLGLHNIFFAEDYRKEFTTLFKDKKIYNDPTVYLFISKKQIDTDAPEGCENWFTMINVAPDTGQNWEMLITEARKNILKKLSQMLGEEIAPLIEVESILGPREIELNTSSYQGALYGTSSNNKWAAFLRHGNRLGAIKNLYFAGGSVHPGGGIPLCLYSAKIVDGWIKHNR